MPRIFHDTQKTFCPPPYILNILNNLVTTLARKLIVKHELDLLSRELSLKMYDRIN